MVIKFKAKGFNTKLLVYFLELLTVPTYNGGFLVPQKAGLHESFFLLTPFYTSHYDMHTF